MPVTTDDQPGARVEEEVRFEDRTADGNPTQNGAVRYLSDDLVVKTSSGVKSLTASAGGGITASEHRGLDQLPHAIAEDSFEEYIYAAGKITDIIVWTDNGKTQKIREESYTYSGGKVTQIVTKQYDGAGALVVGETMTEAVTYSGTQPQSIDRVMS